MAGYKISGFYDEVSTDLNKQIAMIKELGEEYICPRSINGKNIASFTADEFAANVLPKLNEAGIKISSLGSPIGKVNWDDEAGFQKQLGQLEELVKIAKLTNCKYIRTFSFYMGANPDYDKIFAQIVPKIQQFVQKVEGTDIILLHENEKEIYGDVPERALQLYHAINHPNYKLCYDASNYIQCKTDPVKAYEMTKEFTVYYHIKDCSQFGVEVPVGTGLGNYPYLLADILKRGYDGFFTLEPHTLKYALLKPFVYFIPFAKFAIWKFFKGFRYIDKAMGVGYFKRVSAKQVFIWQYQNLKKLLSEAK